MSRRLAAIKALSKLKAAETESGQRLTPEKTLWLMVLERGLRDVALRQKDAIKWMLDNRIQVGSYLWICQLLNYACADEIRLKMVEDLREGKPVANRFSARSRAPINIRVVFTGTGTSSVPRGYGGKKKGKTK